MFALIEFSGKQYRVEAGKEIKVPRIQQEVGTTMTLDKVLYYSDEDNRVIGQPYVENAAVQANILRHGRDRKILVFKMKRRKGYQRKNGHRQSYSVLKIDSLNIN